MMLIDGEIEKNTCMLTTFKILCPQNHLLISTKPGWDMGFKFGRMKGHANFPGNVESFSSGPPGQCQF